MTARTMPRMHPSTPEETARIRVLGRPNIIMFGRTAAIASQSKKVFTS